MTSKSAEKTDELRRLALQLAIQLPERASDARHVLALTGELLDTWMIEDGALSPSDRARRMGWRLGVVDQTEVDAPRPPLSPSAAQAIGWSLATLLVTVPAGMAMDLVFGVGAGFFFAFAVIVVSIVFGTWPAVALALINPLAQNLLVTPPALSFQTPTTREIICAVGYVLFALTVPPVMRRLPTLRRLAARPRPVIWLSSATRSGSAPAIGCSLDREKSSRS